MALIDVVKIEPQEKVLISKYPSEDLKMGTQVIVKPGQQTIFVKGGKVCDVLDSGTHTLNTQNLPLLNKLINLPFGGNSPFSAEVWFVNKVAVLDNKWGTKTPLNLEDPRYKIIVPVRAFGQYGVKIKDPEVFMNTLFGALPSMQASDIQRFFQGKIISSISTLIGKKITQEGISLIDIPAHLEELSLFCQTSIASEFNKFGLEVPNFFFESVNIPQDDPSFIKLKEAKEKAMHINTVGRDIYQLDRSMDVMDTAAGNEGSAGSVMGAGMGLGMGMGMGQGMGQGMANMSQNISPNINTPPPVPSNSSYLLHINGQQHGPYPVDILKGYLNSGQVAPDTLAWKEGFTSWVKLSELPEFNAGAGATTTPPPPPPPVM